jgi:hypothetical protein
MTLREGLKRDLQRNYKLAPKKFINQNGLELTWSSKENIYIGVDEHGIEWIAALQNTNIPIFAAFCSQKVKRVVMEVEMEMPCGAANFVPITINTNETITCRQCKRKFIPELNINPSSAAFELFHNLDK